jgi:hypothetical protein
VLKVAQVEVASAVYDLLRNLHFLIVEIAGHATRHHVLLELAHEFHVVERVDLQLRQFVVEAALTHLGRLRDVGLHRKLFAGCFANGVATFAHFEQFRVRHCVLYLVKTGAASCKVSRDCHRLVVDAFIVATAHLLIQLQRLLVVVVANLLLVVLRETDLVCKGLSAVVVDAFALLSVFFELTPLTLALTLHQFDGLPEFTLPQFFFVLIIYLVVRLIVSNVVLFLLIGQHFVEQLLDFLTVFAFVSIAISIPVVTLQVSFQSSIEFLASISHQNVIAALIALISLTKFVDFLESFGLLVLLGVQA